MTIVQQPDSLSFCGNLKDFIITGESELSFSLYSGSTILIAETYTAYNNKIIIPCKKVIEQQFTICLPDCFFSLTGLPAPLSPQSSDKKRPTGYRCFCTNKGSTGF